MTETPNHRSDVPDEGSPSDAELQHDADAGTHEGTHAGSDSAGRPSGGGSHAAPTGDTPHTEVHESDPNADSREGLAGEMGVSSERPGPVRGSEGDVTYGTAPTYTDDDPEGDVPPEQSADDGRPEPNPPSPGRHEIDTDRNPGHGL